MPAHAKLQGISVLLHHFNDFNSCAVFKLKKEYSCPKLINKHNKLRDLTPWNFQIFVMAFKDV